MHNAATEALTERFVAAWSRAPEALVRATTRNRISIDGRTLDRRVQHVTAIQRSGAPVGLHLLPVRDARRMHIALARAVDPPNGPYRAPTVARVEERTYTGPGGRNQMRIYRPHTHSRPAPTLVYIHGGGFVVGEPSLYDGLCQRLAVGASCNVINIAYRLAPEHPFPAPAEDACAAVRYVFEHADELGVDASRVAVGGDSAGGCLTAVACNARAREGDVPQPVAQLLIYPITEVGCDTPSRRHFASGFLLDEPSLTWFRKNHAADPSDHRASPLLDDGLAAAPPAFVLTAGFDPLRDEGRAYAERLAESGVDVVYREYSDTVHGFVNMAFCQAMHDAVDDMCGVLRAAFNGGALSDALPGRALTHGGPDA